ncbi:DNA-binding protein [Streptomyces sp. H10-C2]|uniref:DNA-binding protein n=1 Tax=unclassified Streptomyces TaxID=2593676 RepID=UPI0024BA3411|nr:MULTISPECIES: DNA-binding protein [unclassified Streptomyces]MDJ0340235.1 DNA-binding protein [Streptomyces sp. PH10-H1]MDJ0368316.1 DNA-binding protein [Streptomyces sp. H10-C2]
MDPSPHDAVSRAQEQQRTWYGEPLGDLFRRLMGDLGLNQARMATALGLSAPMLSQLMSGQRAKIGNPAVVQRLQAIQDLAGHVAEGSVTPSQATARLEDIRQLSGTSVLNTGTHSSSSGTAAANAARHVVRDIQSLLRAVASAEEIAEAANTLASSHPQLAEFLHVYGAGRTADAIAHYEANQN